MSNSTGMIVVRGLSIVLATLSVLSLIRDTFHVGLSRIVEQVIDYYQRLTHVLFGWMEPYLVGWIRWLHEFINIDINLHDHWRHVFVLIGLYYIRDTRVFFTVRDYFGALHLLVLGLLISLATSALVGTLGMQTNSYYENLLACAIVLWGLAIYRTIRSIWGTIRYKEKHEPTYFSDYRHRLIGSLRDVIVGFVIAAHILLVPHVQDIKGIALIVLALLVLLFALRHLANGWRRTRGSYDSQSARWKAFRRHGNTMVAFDIIGVYVSVLFAIIASAGLERLGI
jgi:hypothetical protein